MKGSWISLNWILISYLPLLETDDDIFDSKIQGFKKWPTDKRRIRTRD